LGRARAECRRHRPVTYFNLKQDGTRITGSIRVTQFYYLVTESKGDAGGFTLVGIMKDGPTERRVEYEGKLVGQELHLPLGVARRTNPLN